jgi:hypothetical protein
LADWAAAFFSAAEDTDLLFFWSYRTDVKQVIDQRQLRHCGVTCWTK